MKNETQAIHSAWKDACAARRAFWLTNVDSWTEEAGVTYREMTDLCDSLWFSYLSLKTGVSAETLEKNFNGRIHSARD